MSQLSLGISLSNSGGASVLYKQGQPVCVFDDRVSHEKVELFPQQSIQYCLNELGASFDDLAFIAVAMSDDFDRPLGNAMPEKVGNWFLKRWVSQKLFDVGGSKGRLPKIIFPKSYLLKSISDYHQSSFQEAYVLDETVSAAGSSMNYWHFQDGELMAQLQDKSLWKLRQLVLAVGRYLGFVNEVDRERMFALRFLGKPKFTERILKYLVDLDSEGNVRIGEEYVQTVKGQFEFTSRFTRLFPCEESKPGTPLNRDQLDFLNSILEVIEEIVVDCLRQLLDGQRQAGLCLSGDIFPKLLTLSRMTHAELLHSVSVPVVDGEYGRLLGACWQLWSNKSQNDNLTPPLNLFCSQLGPRFAQPQIESFLIENRVTFETMTSREICEEATQLLLAKKSLGWFRGAQDCSRKMPLSRSMISFPLSHRERPKWVPQKADGSDIFCGYILVTEDFLKKLSKDQVSNELGNASLGQIRQVTGASQPELFQVLEQFYQKSGIPYLLAQPFHGWSVGETLTPHEAVQSFLQSSDDYLFLENCVVDRVLQDSLNL